VTSPETESSKPTESTQPVEDIRDTVDVKALVQKLSSALGSQTPLTKESHPLPHTEAAYRAALADTFSIDELEVDPQTDEVRTILACTEMVMLDGKRRLRLADEPRGKFLNEVHDSESFQRILRALHEQDNEDFANITNDLVRLPTAWLRCFLIGEFGDVLQAPASELRAAVTALERLQFFKLPPNVPTLKETTRLLNLAELLEPLRILIGVSGGWDGSRYQDRFVGRASELRELRSFVDELESEDVSEAVVRTGFRLGNRVARAVTGRSAGVMVWAARGGLGKTALIAKFVLDHALAQTRPFPFAYLDFDRSVLQPRDPRLLLVEVAGQVALQFPAIEEALSNLRQRLRAELTDPRAPRVSDPFGTFRMLVREQIASHGSRAFLLVLDTMELVQYDPRAIGGLVTFIELLYDGGFPELRVVAAGRADVPELRDPGKTRARGRRYTLNPLPINDAAAMAERLGQDLLGKQWRPGWARRIAGKSADPPQRREPLSIRVAVELLRGAKDEVERDRLSREIEEKGEDAHTDFAAALYQQRVLEHVRDSDVRALAWPGLVLRRVTREIAGQLLAPLCGLTRERAVAAFDGLAREAWIVEHQAGRAGKDEVLVHRADLRSRTLPLMRQHDQNLFDEVNNAAIGYFEKRKDHNASDRAEWLYHRMLRGDPADSLEPAWDDEIGALLVGAEADLPRESDAASFLAAMTSTRLMSPTKLAHLPPRLALEHLARTAPHLGAFNETSFEQHLLLLPPTSAIGRPLSPIAQAAAATLAVKTGHWSQTAAASPDPGPWREYQDYATRFLRARIFGMAPMPYVEGGTIERGLSGVGYGALVQELAAARLFELDSFDYADASLERILAKPSTYVINSDLSLLRLVMLFGENARGPATERWLEAVEAIASQKDSEPPTLSLSEMRAISTSPNEMQTLFGPIFDEVSLSGSARERLDAPTLALRFQSRSIPIVLSKVVTARSGEAPDFIRRFAAARSEDWLLPIAYAVARCTNGERPSELMERLSTQDPNSSANWFTQTFRSAPTYAGDMLQLLRRADEAGDLVGTAKIFLDRGQGAAVADLKILLYCLDEWRRRIDDLLLPNGPHPSAPPFAAV
jgi:hypothetical protein